MLEHSVDKMLMSEYPNTLIHTYGEYVGLPDGTMGNSEVGHQNIGAGRIVPRNPSASATPSRMNRFSKTSISRTALNF